MSLEATTYRSVLDWTELRSESGSDNAPSGWRNNVRNATETEVTFQMQAQTSGALLQAPSSGAQLQAPSSGAQLQAPSSGAQLQAPSSGAQLQAPSSGAQPQAPSSGAQLQARQGIGEGADVGKR